MGQNDLQKLLSQAENANPDRERETLFELLKQLVADVDYLRAELSDLEESYKDTIRQS